MNFAAFYQRSIDTPDAFWREEAEKIDWHTPFSQVLDYSRPPFAKWFVGGTTNLCHNAVDRWVDSQGDAAALIAISTETNTERTYSFRELQREVERCAAILQSLGVVNNLVTQQAFMLSTQELFHGSALLFLLMIPLVWLARRPAGAAAGDAGGAH